jgi:hypothetical protein
MLPAVATVRVEPIAELGMALPMLRAVLDEDGGRRLLPADVVADIEAEDAL